ncbi:MAG TPA: class I SAM-dependent methyltransferase [Dehalococcoidia bacterium]|jgi:predicted TPR repeat methyltransferase|nr:class I SAM-dependent methyltransferase [Dehalococcoidia bacterium]|tara:strand:+ start:46 stop:738 length:693 start_codon:yes stop_codon:yes gene_type:complete
MFNPVKKQRLIINAKYGEAVIMANLDDKIGDVYASTDDLEIESKYDTWSGDYDSDLGGITYLLPMKTAEILAKHLNASAVILDAGAGTGLFGEEIHRAGFKNLTAIDLSEKMLDMARAKNVYKDVRKMKLGERLDFSDSTFDAVSLVGVFALGHAKPSSLDEIIRICKTDGIIIFSINKNAYYELGFKNKVEALEHKGSLIQIEKTEWFIGLGDIEETVYHQITAFRVNK